MTMQTQMMGAGIPAGAAQAISGFSTLGVAAAGTNQATATLITTDMSQVTTVAAGSGVILRGDLGAGDTQTVFNGGANALLVYPAVGQTIGTLAVNAGYSVPVGKCVRFTNFSGGFIIPQLSA